MSSADTRVRVPRKLSRIANNYAVTMIFAEIDNGTDSIVELYDEYGEEAVKEAFARVARRIAPLREAFRG